MGHLGSQKEKVDGKEKAKKQLKIEDSGYFQHILSYLFLSSVPYLIQTGY